MYLKSKMVVAEADLEAPKAKEEIKRDHLLIATGLSSLSLEKLTEESPVDFEDAIAATGYGRFNVLLMLATFFAFLSCVFVTNAVSYIFTKAQCDMNLSMLDMGTVTSITYGGMITSAMLWGFLSDTLGRKRIMVWGFFTTGLLEILVGFSQNFTMLLATKFASGFLFNGPFAVLISYLAELHRTELRARVILLTSLFYTFGNVALPLFAWALLTTNLNFYIFGNNSVIHAWNLFLLATALVLLITGMAFVWMPESPKFLMSRGRNDEALEVFQKMYMLNTGKNKEDFPIKRLVEDKSALEARGIAALRGGWAQLAPLYKVPHGPWLLFICIIHFGTMSGANTIRLWYPQLAAMIQAGTTESLCSAIAPSAKVPNVESDICMPIATDMMTYLQSAIVGAGSLLTYAIGGAIVNRCGKKLVAGLCSIVSTVIVAMMPLMGDTAFHVVVMVMASLSLMSLQGASLSSINVEMFPTSLRVMAMATFMMVGRLGTIAGTVAFPVLLEYGCMPPFFVISAILAVCGFCSFLLPDTTLKNLA